MIDNFNISHIYLNLSVLQCKPQAGFKFSRGAYRCDCKQGHEYQIRDGKFWIEGSLIELEYEKKQKKLFSRYVQKKNKKML